MTQRTLTDLTDNDANSTDSSNESNSPDASQSGRSDPDNGLARIAARAGLHDPRCPHLDATWEPPTAEYSLETRWLADTTQLESSGSVEPVSCRWITGGDLTEYLRRYGDKRIRIPSTFSDLRDSWEPYVGLVDTSTSKGGWGISAKALEHAIRVLSGPGSFDDTRFKVIGCREFPWVVIHSKGCLLCSAGPVSVSAPTKNNRRTTITLDGSTVDVKDEAEHVIDGLTHTASTICEAFDMTVAGYGGLGKTRTGHHHTFGLEVDDSEPIGLWFPSQMMSRIGTAQRTYRADNEPVTAIPSIGEVVGDEEVVVGYERDTRAHSGADSPESDTVIRVLAVSIGPRKYNRDGSKLQLHTKHRIQEKRINGCQLTPGE